MIEASNRLVNVVERFIAKPFCLIKAKRRKKVIYVFATWPEMTQREFLSISAGKSIMLVVIVHACLMTITTHKIIF